LDRKLGGPQTRSGRGGEEKNSQPRRESNPRTPIVQPVAQRYTDLSRLLEMKKTRREVIGRREETKRKEEDGKK
jgi:hypothetical protein